MVSSGLLLRTQVLELETATERTYLYLLLFSTYLTQGICQHNKVSFTLVKINFIRIFDPLSKMFECSQRYSLANLTLAYNVPKYSYYLKNYEF